MSSGDFMTGYMLGSSDDPFSDIVGGLQIIVAGFLFARLEFVPEGEGIIYGIGFVVSLFILAAISRFLGIIIAIGLTAMTGYVIHYFAKDMSETGVIIAIAVGVLLSAMVNFTTFVKPKTERVTSE